MYDMDMGIDYLHAFFIPAITSLSPHNNPVEQELLSNEVVITTVSLITDQKYKEFEHFSQGHTMGQIQGSNPKLFTSPNINLTASVLIDA